jgi:hypothetical protein
MSGIATLVYSNNTHPQRKRAEEKERAETSAVSQKMTIAITSA